MNAALKRHVWERAESRCEYCRLRQEHEPARPFNIEHIIPIRHAGADDESNLALSCRHCNMMKGPCIASLDPDGHGLTRLFHPRKDRWIEHFRFDGPFIVGLTDIGRTTVWFLDMNTTNRVRLRILLAELGESD